MEEVKTAAMGIFIMTGIMVIVKDLFDIFCNPKKDVVKKNCIY